MKMIKKILFYILIFSFITTSLITGYHFIEIQKYEKEYETYYYEKADIQLTISGFSPYLSRVSKNNPSEYAKAIQEVGDFSNQLKKEFKNLDISYKLEYANFYKNEIAIEYIHLMDSKYLEQDNIKIIQGRDFTDQENQDGFYGAIVSQSLVYRYGCEDTLEIGDVITIDEVIHYSEFRNSELSDVNLEVIGIYESKNIIDVTTDEEAKKNGYIYIPGKTILEIGNKWNSESIHIEEPYTRYEIMNRIYCENEAEVDEVIEKLKVYEVNSPFSLVTTRYDDHKRPDFYFEYNISEHQKKMQKFGIVTIIFALILIIIISIQYFNKKKEQKRFESIILKEQEKNVQNILMMNQDTHKLKHDLKHFFQQLMVYVDNDDKEKVKELLKEYHEEIISLEIPAFTQNSTVDMIINHYISKSKKMKVDFTYSGTLVSDLNIKQRKLYILLSNALENAFIHSDERKIVKMDMGCVGNYCRFVITNTYHEQAENQENRHGYGIISMKKIIEEVKGEITFDVQNDLYVCTILIPIQD